MGASFGPQFIKHPDGMRIPRKSGSVKNKLQRIAVHAELVNADNPSRAHHALLRDMPGVQPLERVMGIEPTRPAWKAGILPLNYTRRCNGHYYSQTGANCQGILKNFFLFQCPFPKCVFILYHILHQDAREISQKSFVFSLRFSH